MNARELKMTPAQLAAEQSRQLAAAKARTARTAPKRAGSVAKKKATREERTRRTAEIRSACVKRADGRGELSGAPLSEAEMQMCHLDGGSGKRIPQQSVRNCLMEHALVHALLDRHPLAFLADVKAWCARHGYPLPERFRKLEALRSTPTAGGTR